MKVEKNELWAERADQKHINNLPLAQQFALTAVKLHMFGGKTRHVWHPIRTCFFVSCSCLDATDGSHNFWAQLRLHSLCILQGGGRGGRGYFLNGQNFLRSPPYHTEFFHNTPLDQKKILAVLTRTEEDIKVQALYFFEAQIPSQSTSATEGTDYL